MSRSYYIRPKTKLKIKCLQQNKQVSTPTFDSPHISHIPINYRSHKQSFQSIHQPIFGPCKQKQLQNFRINHFDYSGLFPFANNDCKIQAYRRRLSLDFRELHKEQKLHERQMVRKSKERKQEDNFLIMRKARMMTENIYQQQLQRYRQQAKLLGRIKQRLELLRDINEQKSQLIRNYYLSRK